MTVQILITVGESAGDAVRVQVTGVAAAMCDCGGDAAGQHDPLCGSIIGFEPMPRRSWPFWFRRRHYRPARRRRP